MKIKAKVLLLIILGLGLNSCYSPPTPVGLTVELRRVVSGQTLEVLTRGESSPKVEKVRLLGINAPDWQQNPWGTEAKEKLEELVTKETGELGAVLLESDGESQDPFGRRLANVWYEGKLINEELVKQGYALAELKWLDGRYRERLVRAQEYARLMGYGIWNPEQPMRFTPAEFRSEKKFNR